MPLFSTATRAARAELRAARIALDEVDISGPEETEEYLDANDRVRSAEQALAWWQRIGVWPWSLR